MIRRLAAVLACAALLWSLGAVSPADAGQPNTLDVVKVVEGSVPDGTEFIIDVFCIAGPTVETTTLTFPSTGGTQTVTGIGGELACNVQETDDGGAESVTFACQVTGATTTAACNGTNSVTYLAFAGDQAIVTVTNTFPDDEDPAVTDTAPDTAPDAVVAATPTFTG